MAASETRPRSSIVAAVLSAVIPGAGQWYAGKRKRAIAFFVPLVVLIVAALIYRNSVGGLGILGNLVQPDYLVGLMAGNIAIAVWRIAAAVDAYLVDGRHEYRSGWTWGVLAVLGIALAMPHLIAGSYTLRTIDLLNNVFVPDEPVEAAPTTTTTLITTDTTLPEDHHDEPVTVTRDAEDLLTVEYRSIGLIFQDGIGDPDAIAVQRELRTGTRDAPFVDLGDRVDEDRITILLAGGDRGPGRDGLRTDTMIIATVDLNTGEAALFGIPRNYKRVPLPEDISHDFDELVEEEWEWMPDLDEDGWPDDFAFDEDMDGFPDDWEDIDGDGTPDQPEIDCHCYPDLLNHMYGDAARYVGHRYPDSRDPGMDLVADALGYMIGLEVDYWVLVDMRGFVRLIDAMGGVDVNVVNPLHVGVSPSEEGLPTATVSVEEGEARLSGAEALAYVRWRRGSSDYVRMSRQRCLIRSVAAGADPVTVLTSFTAMADAIEDSVVTNIPLSILPDLVDVMGRVDLHQIATVGLVPPYYNDERTPGRYPIPDAERMRAKVADTLTNGAEETTQIGSEGECGI